MSHLINNPKDIEELEEDKKKSDLDKLDAMATLANDQLNDESDE